MIAMSIETECPLSLLSKSFWKLAELYQFSNNDIQFLFNIDKKHFDDFFQKKTLPDTERSYLVVSYLLHIHRSLRTIFTHNNMCVYSWMSIKRSYLDGLSALEYIKQSKSKMVERLFFITMYLTREVER